MQPRNSLPVSGSSATLASSTSSQSLNPVQHGHTPTSAASPSPLEFPFAFLHIEMVRHFRERDSELRREKAEWLERAKSSDVSGEEEQSVDTRAALIDSFSRQIFAQENCETRLESIGFRVGQVMVERIARNLPRLSTELEIMKCICKEFWIGAFGKGVDNLKTNHQGIYTMQDNRFYTLTAFSDGQQYLREAVVFLAMPAGIVRGALAGLGVEALVTATMERLPVVVFKVELSLRQSGE